MDTRLLCHTDPDLGPEARWLLLQWSRVTGLDQALTCPLQDLYCLLGITTRQAKPALEWLKRHGYLIYESVRHGRGRPLSSHRIALGFRNRLDETPPPDTPHQPVIEALCSHAMVCRASTQEKASNLMTGADRAKKLAPATYWLLAVLLAHAETPGIVRGLSYGHLQAVTGMTRERLKSQLSKLKKLGVIARHQPGMLLSKEGVRMRSVYFIDLTHSLLLGDASLGLTVTYLPARRPGDSNFISGIYEAAFVVSYLAENFDTMHKNIKKACAPKGGAESLEELKRLVSLEARYSSAYQELRMNAMSLLPSGKAVLPAKADLLRADKLGMGPILKAHIYSYAMMLLSNYWRDIEGSRRKPSSPIDSVMEAISYDLYYVLGVEGENVEPHSNSSLCRCVYDLSHYLAVQLQHDLRVAEHQKDSDFRLADAVFSICCFSNEGEERWQIKSRFLPSDGVFRLHTQLLAGEWVDLSLPEELKLLVKEGGV